MSALNKKIQTIKKIKINTNLGLLLFRPLPYQLNLL